MTITILGGGISGLTVLHYLKQRFANTVDITLFEREFSPGGTIHTLKKDQCLFESGPNGFLDNQPTTLELVRQLKAEDQLIEADARAKRRYVQFNGRLHLVPTGPLSLIQTPLLSARAKCRLIMGVFKKNISTDQSIYNYIAERFGPEVSERLADPFISGIYAGDVKRLHMASTFPKISGPKKNKHRSRMRSFKEGMGQLIQILSGRYAACIKTGQEINSLKELDARHIICAVPAYVAAQLLSDIAPDLSAALSRIVYAPVAVAGLGFDRGAFKKDPDGFGYLVPSQEGKDILGVLIESNVFPQRTPKGLVMVRVMLGGIHHPAIINDSPDQILAKAVQEIDAIYGLKAGCVQTFVQLWPKAIPQYELDYPALRQTIASELVKVPGLHLCANYLDGISFNDCINNAKSIAGSILI